MLGCTKSTNATVRNGAVNLFKAVAKGCLDVPNSRRAIEQILGPCLSGKSNGPDHRQALYSMLHNIPANPVGSREIVWKLVPFMEKETSEMVLTTLSEVVSEHLSCLLQDDNETALDPSFTTTIAKNLSSMKSTSRRSMAMMIGQTFWAISQSDAIWPPAANDLFQALQQPLEKLLSETVTMSPTAMTGPVEAWVALTILSCACQKSTYGKIFPSFT